MSRPVGLPKSGGRARGTPNKRTFDLASELEMRGFSLLEEILSTLPELPPEKRVAALIGLLPFQYPKRKALELTTHESVSCARCDKAAKMSPEERRQRIRQLHALSADLDEVDQPPEGI